MEKKKHVPVKFYDDFSKWVELMIQVSAYCSLLCIRICLYGACAPGLMDQIHALVSNSFTGLYIYIYNVQCSVDPSHNYFFFYFF